MAVYLSPGVFTSERDLSLTPSSTGPVVPAFVGTAKKGPLNIPTFLANAQQGIDTFGEPTPSSYLMHAVLSFFEQGSGCWAMRVGVECEDGQVAALDDICIDTSGAKGKGWGRIPLFTGIDYGRISFRELTEDQPFAFHNAAVDNNEYNDADVSSTDGATSATITTTGTYTGSIDDSFIVTITSPPSASDGASVDGAGYEVLRNSDGEIVAEGNLIDGNDDGVSDWIPIGDGLSIRITVTAGVLDTNDTFTFTVQPNNRSFSVSVEGESATTHTMPVATYADLGTFITAFNALVSSEDYLLVAYTRSDGVEVAQIRTRTAGQRVQLMSTAGFAFEVGSQLYAWDIPRAYLLGLSDGPFDITTQNNRVKLNVVGDAATNSVEFNIPNGLNQTVTSVTNAIDLAGTVAGETLWDSFVLTVPGGTTLVVIVTTENNKYDTLQLVANYTNLKTLRFAEEVDIPYPYKRSYRGFNDNRLLLPDSGETDAATPLSCEDDPLGDDCASDTAYFQNIVGWLVAPTPGTWVDGYTVSVELFTDGVGEVAGRYRIIIRDDNGVVIETVNDVSFDKTATRYIGNVVNPGSRIGGTSGNTYLNWEARPTYLDFDENDTANYTVRLPAQFASKEFSGQADGIPTDPAYSSELDAAIIGNPAISSGLYAFQNPETYDITLLSTPGFSSGAVIGTALQICENRGDVLYLVDPPFGLRPQQVVDWHNGILVSDLSAAINSSYGALYWSWLRSFDQFNNEELWVPPSGHVAAVYSRTARERELWFAPAGLQRGRLLTALNVEYAPSIPERDLLYGSGNAVNPIAKFPRDGIVVFGDRTLQRADTLLDRVPVRLLLIAIKKSCTELLRNFIFEPNDRILWRQVSATIEPFLADIQARRGLQAFKVVCDESNNTPQRQDRHELWVSIFVKPIPTVEFVVLNITLLQSQASFAAEEVLAAGGIVTQATAT